MVEWMLLGGVVLLLVAYGFKSSSRKGKKQCPWCGAYVPKDAHVCAYCAYRFDEPEERPLPA